MIEAPLLPTPLEVHRRFVVRSWLGGILALAVGVAATLGFIAWQIGAIRDIARDQRVWSEGLVAGDVRVEGHETSHNFVLNSYELTVTFTTREGQSRSEKRSFETFWESVDQDSALEARYDAADPSWVVLSWQIHAVRGRWYAVVFMLAAGLLIGASFLTLGVVALRRYFVVRGVAAGFEELEVPVVRIVEIRANGRPTGALKYEFVIPDEEAAPGKRPRRHNATFHHKKGQAPIFLSEDDRTMLAVRPTASRAVPVVPRQDGYPFALSEAARATLTAAVARRRDRDGRSGQP